MIWDDMGCNGIEWWLYKRRRSTEDNRYMVLMVFDIMTYISILISALS